MGRLGHKVAGRRAGEKGFAQPVKARGSRLGHRVSGRSRKVQFSSPAEEAAAQAAAAEAADVDEVVEAPVTANLTELEEALENNPAFYEQLYASEVARAGGPRKGALRRFLAHEEAHDNREERIAEINDLL